MTIIIQHEPVSDDSIVAAITAPLTEYSMRAGMKWNPQPVVLTLRDSTDQIVGGLIGSLQWNWLRIDILAVARELRGRGFGSELVAKAEEVAGDAGCQNVWVDTFDFQSPEFYEKLGFRQFAVLPDYPPGNRRLFYAKKILSGVDQ